MITGTPMDSDIFWPRMRAKMSLVPPGANGTINLAGCAAAVAELQAKTTTVANFRIVRKVA
jgi:hypothetical protein